MKKIMKLLWKRGTALVCAVVMLAGMLPGISIPVMAAEIGDIESYTPQGYGNISIAKTVTVSSDIGNKWWRASNLVDGWLGSDGKTWAGWSTAVNETTDQATEAWATIDLGKAHKIKQVGIFPRSDGNYYGYAFPVDYKIQVSDDNQNWDDIHVVTEQALPTEPVIVSLETVENAQYVRLLVTKRAEAGNDGCLVQLSEIAVWGLDPDMENSGPEGYENVSLGKTVSASSAFEVDAIRCWRAMRLVDGVGLSSTANGWSTDPYETVTETTEASVVVDLGEEYDLGRVDLYPRSDGNYYGYAFPVDYKIQVSSDNANWSDVATVTDAEKPTTGPVQFSMPDGTKGQYVRLLVKERRAEGASYLVQVSEMVVWGKEPVQETPTPTPEPEKDRMDISAFAPEGLDNLALNKSVTASSTYEAYGFNKSDLVDEVLGDASGINGWSTNSEVAEAERTETTPAWVIIDLENECEIKQIGLFPRSDGANQKWYGCGFPVDYTIETSTDKKTWTPFYAKVGQGKPDAPVIAGKDSPVTARYVRLNVTKRGNRAFETDGYLVQLSELAVWGTVNDTLNVNKDSLLLEIGDTETIKTTVVANNQPSVSLTWNSNNESVAKVDQNGKITAVAIGTAKITVKCEELKIEKTIDVEVVNSRINYDDNILIAIFWPPTLEYMGDDEEKWEEQYDLLKEADIDLINNVAGNDLNDKSTNLKMMEYAAERGMVVSVADDRMGEFVWFKAEFVSPEEIKEIMSDYRNRPGLGGYYILDEPHNPNEYLDTYVAMKEADPDFYMHLNFLVQSHYADYETYKNQMRDYLRLSEAAGYPQDYLMYDMYPYGDKGGNNTDTSMRRELFYSNMRAAYEVGKESGVKTANYLQSVQIPKTYRRPTVPEIRYEAMMSLAFGYKQLSYFTWFTPSNRSEPFDEGIILLDGEPNEKLYDGISALNKEIHALGNVLIDLEAEEVYLNGETWGQPSIPKDFFAQPVDNTNYTVSFLRNPETKRNYMMVVNNDYTNPATIKLDMDDQITSLLPISATDGSRGSNALSAAGTLELSLEAGDGRLFELPEGVDYYESDIKKQVTGENLAKYAYVLADSSTGDNDEYIGNLNDEDRKTGGWSSEGKTAEITMDLKTERTFNRVDLYPVGDMVSYQNDMPTAFEIQVSDNGVNFTTVYTETALNSDGLAEEFNFDDQTARYVRLKITDCSAEKVRIGEIEVYLDDGTLAEPEGSEESEIVDYTEGENIALKKKVYVSSATGESHKKWGWATEFVNDGDTSLNGTLGWTSNPGRNTSEDAEEWVIIDLGDKFSIDTVKLLPTGFFAVDYQIEISDNGRDDWKTIATKIGDNKDDTSWREFNVSDENPITGRYLRVKSSKLNQASSGDGYLMQIAEIEAYGTPATDKTKAKKVLEEAKALKDSTNADTTALEAAMEALSAAIDSELTTQRRLDDLTAKVEAEIAAVEAVAVLPNPNKGDSSSSSKDEKDTEPVEVHYANGNTTTTTAANAKTGDSAMIVELCVAMLVCVAGFAFVLVKRRKKDIS